MQCTILQGWDYLHKSDVEGQMTTSELWSIDQASVTFCPNYLASPFHRYNPESIHQMRLKPSHPIGF